MTKENSLRLYKHFTACIETREYNGKSIPDTSLKSIKEAKAALEKKYPEFLQSTSQAGGVAPTTPSVPHPEKKVRK